MAGVDHAYQYSVEVKSRFSLFMDDDLNSEDPDLLLSKLQTQRAVRVKKDKTAGSHPSVEPKKPEQHEEVEVRNEQVPVKAKPVRMPKVTKVVHPQPTEEHVHVDDDKQMEEDHAPATQRSPSGPRGFSRGFRGRMQGSRPQFEGNDSMGDPYMQRDIPYEPRGRGRGRGRGVFNRGRGSMYTDYREYDRPSESVGGRPYRRDGFEDNRRITDEEVIETAAHVNSENTETIEPGNVTEDAVEDHVNNDSDKLAEEEVKQYTLDEYKAMVSSAKPSVILSSKNTRKPNDGKNVFANMVEHRKLNEIVDQEVEVIEEEPEEPQAFDIDVTYSDSFAARSRGRRGFGGRGFGFRGGRPRGERGGRGGRGSFRGEGRGRGFSRGMAVEHQTAPPAIYNDQEFPSLK